jgi:hypothetical protein
VNRGDSFLRTRPHQPNQHTFVLSTGFEAAIATKAAAIEFLGKIDRYLAPVGYWMRRSLALANRCTQFGNLTAKQP